MYQLGRVSLDSVELDLGDQAVVHEAVPDPEGDRASAEEVGRVVEAHAPKCDDRGVRDRRHDELTAA